MKRVYGHQYLPIQLFRTANGSLSFSQIHFHEFLEENADQENMPQKVNWHMIGHLQRNKVKQALKICSLIHSVDTLRLAEEINTAANKLEHKINILLQVNCSGEPQKYGAPVGAATHLAEQFSTMNNIRLVGIMTMAPLTLNKDVVRACFIRAREIFEEIRGERLAGSKFKQLSMGMSQDYEIAIEEGATLHTEDGNSWSIK